MNEVASIRTNEVFNKDIADFRKLYFFLWESFFTKVSTGDKKFLFLFSIATCGSGKSSSQMLRFLFLFGKLPTELSHAMCLLKTIYSLFGFQKLWKTCNRNGSYKLKSIL